MLVYGWLLRTDPPSINTAERVRRQLLPSSASPAITSAAKTPSQSLCTPVSPPPTPPSEIWLSDEGTSPESWCIHTHTHTRADISGMLCLFSLNKQQESSLWLLPPPVSTLCLDRGTTVEATEAQKSYRKGYMFFFKKAWICHVIFVFYKKTTQRLWVSYDSVRWGLFVAMTAQIPIFENILQAEFVCNKVKKSLWGGNSIGVYILSQHEHGGKTTSTIKPHKVGSTRSSWRWMCWVNCLTLKMTVLHKSSPNLCIFPAAKGALSTDHKKNSRFLFFYLELKKTNKKPQNTKAINLEDRKKRVRFNSSRSPCLCVCVEVCQ